MRNLFLIFFEISVSASVIILLLLILAPLLNRRYAAKWNYYIWIMLALRLIIPFRFDLSFPRIKIAIPEQMTMPVTVNTEAVVPIILQTEQNIAKVTLLDIIFVVWFVVCIGFLSVHISCFLFYKWRVVKNGTYMKDSSILKLLFQCKRELKIKQRIALIKSPNVESPMIIGFFKPVLAIPDNKYRAEEIYFILKHELVHLKRQDTYIKFLFVAANALHWFNPVIYIMRKEAAIDMELSCDEKVIQGTPYSVRKAYTETLFSTLRRQYKKTSSLSTQFYGDKQIMKKRFKNILTKSKKKSGLLILICVVALTSFSNMITGCSVKESNTPESQTEDLQEDSADYTTIDASAESQEEPQQDDVLDVENTLSADGQEIKNIAEEFSTAYFSGNVNAIQTYLTVPYEWDMDVYTGTGIIGEIKLKGLANVGEEEVGMIKVISCEYKDNDSESLQYLTLEFIKQEDGWKIQFYGIEG